MRAFSKGHRSKIAEWPKMDDADFSGLCPVNKFYCDYVAKEPCNAGSLCVTEELFSRDNGFQRGQEIDFCRGSARSS
jgi:hypothetical protein